MNFEVVVCIFGVNMWCYFCYVLLLLLVFGMFVVGLFVLVCMIGMFELMFFIVGLSM